MAPLSVIVPCFNEEKMIGDCLASAAFADELIVVDSFSTDRTLEIARDFTKRILQHQFLSHGAQNNWAIPQARNDWVLVLDADERITPELANEITALLQKPNHDGYWVRRRNFFLGKEIRHGAWGNDFVLRLFRRDKGRYEEKYVHSSIQLPGVCGRLKSTLLHYSYGGLDDYMRKVPRFVQGGARNLFERRVRSGSWRLVCHSFSRFLKSYVFQRGFLDGTEGLIIAFMEADNAFLKYAKLWELQNSTPPQADQKPAPPAQ